MASRLPGEESRGEGSAIVKVKSKAGAASSLSRLKKCPMRPVVMKQQSPKLIDFLCCSEASSGRLQVIIKAFRFISQLLAADIVTSYHQSSM